MVKSFDNEYRFLSNFYLVPIEYEGLIYPSVENAYQASKCAILDDRLSFVSISPSWAKQLGREVPLRYDFDSIKLDIMYELVKYKFSHNEELRVLLKQTGLEQLVEGNFLGDTFWGVCNESGQNHLGKILMRVRLEV